MEHVRGVAASGERVICGPSTARDTRVAYYARRRVRRRVRIEVVHDGPCDGDLAEWADLATAREGVSLVEVV